MIIIPKLWFYNKCYVFQLLLVTLCMSLHTELMAHSFPNILQIHLEIWTYGLERRIY